MSDDWFGKRITLADKIKTKGMSDSDIEVELDKEAKNLADGLQEIVRKQVVKDKKAYDAKGKAWRKIADKKIWDGVKNRKLLAYWLLEWFNNHGERAYESMLLNEVPSDLDKGLKDELEFLHENCMCTYDQCLKSYEHETGAKNASECDVFLDLLREDSKYWHISDEEHHLKEFNELKVILRLHRIRDQSGLKDLSKEDWERAFKGLVPIKEVDKDGKEKEQEEEVKP